MAIANDQSGFIVRHRVVAQKQGVDIAVPFTTDLLANHALDRLRVDKGSWNPNNHRALKSLVQELIMPKPDTGISIPAERQPHIFDRFHRVDPSSTREYGGTNIGLSLVKALVNLHHSSHEVVSVEGAGSPFAVRLPVGKELFREN